MFVESRSGGDLVPEPPPPPPPPRKLLELQSSQSASVRVISRDHRCSLAPHVEEDGRFSRVSTRAFERLQHNGRETPWIGFLRLKTQMNAARK